MNLPEVVVRDAEIAKLAKEVASLRKEVSKLRRERDETRSLLNHLLDVVKRTTGVT